jgi:CheY-like chemotaxis protein
MLAGMSRSGGPLDAAQRPSLRAFPSSDREFVREVERLYAEWAAEAPQRDDPEAFEALVRRQYPSATVRSQDSLAKLGPGGDVWYVNRRDVEAEGPPAADAVESPGQIATYSTARVAAMAGLPMAVVVAWDEADGLVKPKRTPGGAALYSRDDLEALLFAKREFVKGASVDDVRQALAARPRDRLRRGNRPSGSRRLLILLAERDRYAAEFSEYFLRTEGYEVEVALSAEEAVARAMEHQPDLSVVELLISGGAGAELCARLKTRPGALVLAISSLNAHDAALRAGADAFLVKPFEPLTFVSAVRDLLGDSAIVRSSSSELQEAGA